MRDGVCGFFAVVCDAWWCIYLGNVVFLLCVRDCLGPLAVVLPPGCPISPSTTILLPQHTAKVDGYRYNDDLSIPGKMSYHNWRKSSQWFVLTRAHAEIVRDDALVDPVFKSQCWNNEESRERLCCRYVVVGVVGWVMGWVLYGG